MNTTHFTPSTEEAFASATLHEVKLLNEFDEACVESTRLHNSINSKLQSFCRASKTAHQSIPMWIECLGVCDREAALLTQNLKQMERLNVALDYQFSSSVHGLSNQCDEARMMIAIARTAAIFRMPH